MLAPLMDVLSTIGAELASKPLLYATLPVTAALVGYVTNVLAIKMMFLPIRFIGVGEQLEDLRPFNAEEFVQALFEDVAR